MQYFTRNDRKTSLSLTEKRQSVLFTLRIYCNKIKDKLKRNNALKCRKEGIGMMPFSDVPKKKTGQDAVTDICVTAVFMAAVCMMTFLPRIPIPFGYAHLGDAIIFLMVLFLSKRQAATAAAIGSALADFLGGFPIWIIPTVFIKWGMVEIVFRIAVGNGSTSAVQYWRTGAAFLVSALWMIIAYAGIGAVLYGSAGAGMLMIPGLAGEGIINVAAAMAAQWLLQHHTGAYRMRR